ncbi:MAG: DNA-directed RNA polymerase subunit beta', partial [Selenomonadaceae bacterium]|nr:DNA-directed RNA polymerase subunit beta' [Selenomonadaceae bacterium]
IPVIPPELRPMVQLDGGRFATSDLNDLYRRVINRNNRLNRLLNLKAPDIIVRNEKRMLQEAVDALIDNGRRGRPVTGPGNRPLKSLSDMLKGKQGRFRQNLLGKRVDYSGRSVIVVGPELKLHQCGLPKEMALELFKPFVMKKLSADGNTTIKAAKRKVERSEPVVWEVLEEVIKEHPVLLNRAPTLHRLGIQAFEPVLTEGRALRLHPLACTAYNADFDGDQMAIHLPLSAEAQAEARVLMLAANHILAPKDGKPIIVPTQDMVLGTYYMTSIRPKADGEGKIVTGIEEALMAHRKGSLALQAEITARMNVNELPANVRAEIPEGYVLVKTSLGRMIFNEKLKPSLRYCKKLDDGSWQYGKVMNKKELGKLVAACFDEFGATVTAEVIDEVKNLGYHYACLAGMTVAISDVIVPPKKKDIIDATKKKVDRVERQFRQGLLSEEERYQKVVEFWNKATEDVADAMMENMDPFNPIFMMADSGARGNKQQMRQLAGMRGLMADPSGKIIDLPITANFREGLSVSDYFISSHGARKGLADTALRTADSGYLTRRLVDVAQDVIVREFDCDVSTINLKLERALLADETFDAIEILNDALIGRVLAKDIINEETKEVVIPHDTILDERWLEKIGELGTETITLRGRSLTSPNSASHSLVHETITLGTRDESKREELRHAFIHEILGKELAQTIDLYYDTYEEGEHLTHEMIEELLDSDVGEIFVRNHNVRGIEVEAITEGTGVIESLEDRIIGRYLAENIFDAEGKQVAAINDMIDKNLAKKIVAVKTAAGNPRVKIRSVLTCKSQFGVCIKCYGRDLANQAPVEVGEAVGIIAAQSIGEPGTQLTMRTFHTGGVAGDDITQGLPRVEELFEARKPKHNAIIAEVDGVVSIGVNEKNDLPQITITPEIGSQRDYTIPYTARRLVEAGDEVKAGQPLTEGAKNPHDILRVCGLKETQRYLVYEVQKVYKSQGVEINDKHIEVIVRQMLHKVKIEESGDTEFLPGEFVDINVFEAANTKAIESGKMPAVAKPILLGITKASLATDSFLSAASFQETTKVLTDAAIKGKVDPLIGLKENVIIGKLIPAGTGMSRYRDLKVVDVEAEEVI